MNDKVEKALLFAAAVHENQKRKDGKPYITHPAAVARELEKNGAEDDLICAGLLHDTIEDGGVTPEEIADQFGREVLRIVLFDTEDKRLSWQARKEATLDDLEHCDRKCAMLVCADKLANIRDVQSGLAQWGESVWSRFKYGREKQEWLYRAYVDRLAGLSDLKMYEELKSTVEQVFTKKGENDL